jgi:GntR family galactonate operon transcriptional repressor
VSRLHTSLASILLDEIATGRRRPGDRLPTVQALAEAWDVGTEPARATLLALEHRGVITLKPRRGATVNPIDRWNLLDSDVVVAVLGGPYAGAVLDELLECRIVLEVQAARLAAARATQEQREALREALDQLESRARSRTHDRTRSEIAFHRLLITASHNRPLARMAAPVLDAMEHVDIDPPRHGSHDAYATLLDAIDAHAPTAAEHAIRRHLETVADELRRNRERIIARGRRRQRQRVAFARREHARSRDDPGATFG